MRYCRYTELVCQCLAYWDEELRDRANHSLVENKINWRKLLFCADQHRILPSLFFSLNHSGLLNHFPEELSEWLHAVWTLNRKRNRMLRQALIAVASELNKIGIKPVLLKGAAALLREENSGCFDRVMHDLDLFIPDERSREACGFLQQCGYLPLYKNKFFRDNHHHEVPLQNTKFSVSIELHKHPFPLEKFNDSPVSLQKDGEVVHLEGAEMVLPNDTFRILHNFIDHSIHDRFFFQNRIDLRRLYESVRLKVEQYRKIDWPEIQKYCRKKRIHTAWFTYCLCGRKLFASRFPYQIPRFSYASYREQQVRIHSWFPVLIFFRYWFLRGSRLPARVISPSWYVMKLEDIFRAY